ncbi:MAG: sel1 repeat family protein, partial [Oscillospiraceae bacterium]|nr:sel1 repeat family protein [Oscillospiraceae bacterium]
AEEGSSLACDYLGYLYMTGDMVPADPEKGLAYYRKAAELGNARSMMALGYAYLEGQGVEPDPGAALSWYEQAAVAGRADAVPIIERLKNN